MDRPIGDYGLISDRHSAALVSTGGSVDWLCWPRFDSPSVFARLLDAGAGHWSIRPTQTAKTTRAYLDATMVLRTTFTTPAGTVQLTDALAAGTDKNPHRLGADAPHVLLREITCTAGIVEITSEFRPRPEYGLVAPLISTDGDAVTARGGPATLALCGSIPMIVADGTATAVTTLHAGQTIGFALHWAPLSGPPSRRYSPGDIAAAMAGTIHAWQAWSRLHQNYDGPWRGLVGHSGRVLQALSYQPTGAIIAAPTTSLPETIGGQRNWDYRYTWIRDAALTMDALWTAACPDEASEFFAFLTAAAATRRPESCLQIMYGIGGEHDLTEHELAHLSGWRDSRPVRVGNNAWYQTQLDVYGELLDTAARFADQLDHADDAQRAFLIGLADTAARAWQQPDHGIWEIRGTPRHFLHSKLMCWVALDRALELADRLNATDQTAGWRDTRDQIRTAIRQVGWSHAAGAYTQSFGSDDLDASVLMMAITGFLPADEPRMRATIDAIATRLTDRHGLVYRYRAATGVDGLAGEEGAFLLCTFWLAHAHALAGDLDSARQVFDVACAYANDLGLLAEQADPATGDLLGNFPQAFSHIGLINAAAAIAEASAATR